MIQKFLFLFFHFAIFWSFFPWLVFLLFSLLAIHVRFCDTSQCTKKLVSDNPGLADFAIGLVNSVFNLPHGQVMFFEEF